MTQNEHEIDFSKDLEDTELTLDDLKGSSFIKNPSVGETITLNIKKVVKVPSSTVVLKDGTKFKKSLSGEGVDYYYKITTADGKTYDVTSWEIWKKLSEIFKEKKKTKDVIVNITHIKDGTNKKDKGDNYKVVFVG
jgi:hypothetical protein